MRSIQRGFTLIELVMVIVVIGILAAVAIPKFVDLGSDARRAAMDGVTGALSSAAAINYAARKANSSNGFAVTNCNNTSTGLQGGSLPAGFSIAASAVAADASVSCTVNGPSSTTGSFTAIGIN